LGIANLKPDFLSIWQGRLTALALGRRDSLYRSSNQLRTMVR
jgi:hypothetical protein